MPGTGPQCGGAEGGIAMRRLGVIVALGALLGMFGGVATASPAFAGGRWDGWQFLDFFPGFDSTNCGFLVHAKQDVDKVFVKELKTTDGSSLFLFTAPRRSPSRTRPTGRASP